MAPPGPFPSCPVEVPGPHVGVRVGLREAVGFLATQLVDNGTTSRYKSTAPDAAIADFVHTLMGLGTDRDQTPISILTDHDHSAQTAGLSASDALKSTFVLACESPTSVARGL